MLSISVIALGFTRDNLKPLERTVDVSLISNQQAGNEYLSTFNDAQLNVSDEKIDYTGYKYVKDFYTVDYLSNSSFDVSDYVISFDVLYIKLLDLLYIDVYLIDFDGEVVESISLNGYAKEDGDGYRDIKFDLYGYSFYSTDMFSPDAIDEISMNHNLRFLMMDDSGGGGGGVTYPIVNISNSIVGIDDAVNNAEEYLNPPDVWYDGPMKYFMWKVKLDMAKKDFQHNTIVNNSTTISGYIGDQHLSKWDSWKYGLSNLGNAGCGIFAMFNLFKSTGYTPSLPTLVAVTQLMNADIVFGLFGTNGYPVGTSFSSTTVFDSIVSNVLVPIAFEIIPQIAVTIINAEFENAAQWWIDWFGWTYDIQVGLTIAVLEAAFFSVYLTTHALVEWYWSSVHSMSEVLSLYGINNISNTTNLDTFVSNTAGSQYFIVNLWWDSVPSTNTIDVLSGAHSVFVRRIGNIYRAYNFDPAYESYTDFTNLYEIFDYSRYNRGTYNLSQARLKILSGMVVNPNV